MKDSPNNVPEVSNDTPQLDFLPMEDNTRVDFPSAKIQIPEGWSVAALLNSPTNTGYSCVGDECRVAIVSPTSTESKVAEVIFSTPTYVRVASTPQLEKGSLDVSFAGEQVSMRADRIVVTNITIDDNGETKEGTAASESIYHLYGCNSKDICFYAANLSDDKTINATQVEEIKQLLTSLKFL